MQKSDKYSELKLIVPIFVNKSNTYLMKSLFSYLLFFLLLVSCGESKKNQAAQKENSVTSEQIAANYKSLELEIEGMTCEIGCARTIQSKLSKLEGVNYSKVSFEAKKGQFTFDSNVLSKEDIIEKISGIGGGDLYSVTAVTELEEILTQEAPSKSE